MEDLLQVGVKDLEPVGPLLLDLCRIESKDNTEVQAHFEKISRRLRKRAKSEKYDELMRPWALQIAAQILRPHGERAAQSTNASPDQTDLDRFQVYFQRLPFDHRALLLWSEKHKIQNSELASVFQIPEESIRLRLEMTKRTLTTAMGQPISVAEWITSLLEKRSQPGSDKKNTPIKTKYRWEEAPWFVKSSIEALGVVTLILAVVSGIPKIRTIYEENLEKRLETYDLAEVTPPSASDEEGFDDINQSSVPADDLEGELPSNLPAQSASAAPQTLSPTSVRVGPGEIWRFIVKTDSLLEMMEKISKILTSPPVSLSDPATAGRKVPGGVQFDLLVPSQLVPQISEQIEKTAQLSADSLAEAQANETFRWYKARSRTRVPSGSTRVVIWLSQF